MDDLSRYKLGLINLSDIENDCKWSNLAHKIIEYELERDNIGIAYELLSRMKDVSGLNDITNWHKKLFSYNNKELIKREILEHFNDEKYIIVLVIITTIIFDKADLLIGALHESNYNLEKLVIKIFNNQQYIDYVPIINKLINYTGIEWIKDTMYIDENDRIREWYYNLILNQV